jgi:hypothetical protein
MMHIVKCAVIATAGLMSSAAAPDRPPEFACSAPGGSFDKIANASAGPEHRIRGSVMPVRYRRHRRYLPTATVMFRDAQLPAAVGLQLMRRGSDDTVDVDIVTASSAGRTAKKIGSLRLNEELTFELTIQANGDGYVQAGDRRVDIPIKLTTITEASVSCSTGAFRFRRLDWGSAP